MLSVDYSLSHASHVCADGDHYCPKKFIFSYSSCFMKLNGFFAFTAQKINFYYQRWIALIPSFERLIKNNHAMLIWISHDKQMVGCRHKFSIVKTDQILTQPKLTLLTITI